MPIQKLLIANRGEIAVRILRTARRIGCRTVAIFSDADRTAQHVLGADEAVRIGGADAADSYLAIEKIIDAARRTGADAIHPGYGFLAENATFAAETEAAGLRFVGPPASAVALMGNKRRARAAMREAGVPCVPGYDAESASDATLLAAAQKLGFPLLVKAAAGGGGRGMRRADSQSDLPDALRTARAEALVAFGSDELILERVVSKPRHVEVQVFADAYRHCIHLGERDCSVQRRYQKILEESPSPVVDAALRARIGASAIQAALACGYVGAGTVEFLLDAAGDYFFLEMNTRLQVEHAVTEAVTGLDLVEWQLRVASGEPLCMQQDDVRLRGHAIEARLYAEDPAAGFIPQTGRLVRWSLPLDLGVRIDSGVVEGDSITPHYDPLIAKLIVHADCRESARTRLAGALRDTTVFGVITNKGLLVALLEDPEFAAGEATTALITERFADHPLLAAGAPSFECAACAALAIYFDSARAYAEDESFIGWRSGGPVWSTLRLRCRGRTSVVEVAALGRSWLGRRYSIRQLTDPALLPLDERTTQIAAAPALIFEITAHDDQAICWLAEGIQRRAKYAIEGDRVWIEDAGATVVFDNVTHHIAHKDTASGSGRLSAPLDGSVSQLLVEVGSRVKAGQLLATIEAMKMEHPIRADISGVVAHVAIAERAQVKARQLLFELDAVGEPS